MTGYLVSGGAKVVPVEGGDSYFGIGSAEIEPEDGDYLSLSQLQHAVGGYIEFISVPRFPNFVMVVNEEGALQGMGLNVAASRLALRPVVGDAVVCDRSLIR